MRLASADVLPIPTTHRDKQESTWTSFQRILLYHTIQKVKLLPSEPTFVIVKAEKQTALFLLLGASVRS